MNQGGDGLPTAPRAEDRYANSYRIYNDDPYFTTSMKYKGADAMGVKQYTPYSIIPAVITRVIMSDNDTIYRETPDQKRFKLRRFPKTRTASSKDKNKKEYKILQRRFNTAWKYANGPVDVSGFIK